MNGIDITGPVPVPPTPGAGADALEVVWSKGGRSRALAETLVGDRAVRSDGDLARSCIAAGATLLVTRRLTSFDVCSVAVPHDFVPGAVRSVVAAVGGGPHSGLAGLIASRIAERLGVPGRAVFGRRTPDPDDRAEQILTEVLRRAPGLAGEVIDAPGPADMVDGFGDGTLLVIGAPGGSWFQRQFFGPGARIIAGAPGGNVVVRSAPPRVYQIMQTTTALGPDMSVADALAVTGSDTVFVADHGILVGTVDRRTLEQAATGRSLRGLVSPGVSVTVDEPVEHVEGLFADDPDRRIPVVDATSRLLGAISATDLERRFPGRTTGDR